MDSKKFKRVDVQASLVCGLLVVFASVAVFITCYRMADKVIIDSLSERTDAIYKSLDLWLTEDLFNQLNEESDMSSELYIKSQQKLLDTRELSSVRYLYTAKKNDQGEYVYVIDGLPLGSEDFRTPGALIEEDILKEIDSAYNGAVNNPDEILDTEWGKIFLGYYPIHANKGNSGDIIGVVGIEIDAEAQYNTFKKMKEIVPIIILISWVLAYAAFSKTFRYLSNPTRKDLYNVDPLTGLKNRASFEVDLKTLYDKFTHIAFIICDLDDLKGVNDKYGHLVGDKYIGTLGKTLQAIIQRGGVAYRIGGDEFIIVIDIVEEERIQALIKDGKVHFKEFLEAEEFEGDVSVGYAVYDENVDKTITETIKRADAMMYRNKKKKKRSKNNK